MKEIPLTRGRVAIVDDEHYWWLTKWKWYYGSNGYAVRNAPGKRHKYMHCVIMDTPPGMDTDHINGDRLDNRRSNLRVCTRAQNTHNQKVSKANSSGYKGVHWHKHDKRWRTQIKTGGKKIYLGNFHSKEYAALAYNRGALQYHGAFANLNYVVPPLETTPKIRQIIIDSPYNAIAI